MNLADYLKENKMDIKEFAQKIDYSREHISRIVNGKAKPSPKLKRAIEKFTKLKME